MFGAGGAAPSGSGVPERAQERVEDMRRMLGALERKET